MSLRIRVVGDLRRFVEPETVQINGEKWSLGSAVDELVRLYPSLGRELFDDRGRLHYAVVIVVNGRPVVWPQGKDELIENGGEMMITRFHCGG